MALGGVVTLGLLDSSSDILTLGFTSTGLTAPPDGPGSAVIAGIQRGRAFAIINNARTIANITAGRTLPDLER